EMRDRTLHGDQEVAKTAASATSVESEPDVTETKEFAAPPAPSGGIVEDPTEAGYDEAVERGVPYHAEENIRAENSADPVALTEADPMSVDELVLQEAGRDLRPDVVTPAPALTSATVAELEAEEKTASALETSPDEQAATDESLKDEKQ